MKIADPNKCIQKCNVLTIRSSSGTMTMLKKKNKQKKTQHYIRTM